MSHSEAPPVDTSRLRKLLAADGNRRSVENVIAQYEYERAAAQRLMRASRDERRQLYVSVYEELFRRFPDHSELKVDLALRQQQVQQQVGKIRPLCHSGMTFLEIGAGDCRFAYATAPYVQQVYALEVTGAKLPEETPPPENFQLILFDGFDFPLPDSSVDFAYSNQVLEHLHPEDAEYHLREVYRVLRPEGFYLCITPHRFTGPRDISRYFTRTATALHLKEYTYTELRRMMQQVGFQRYSVMVGARVISAKPVLALEQVLGLMPYGLRKRVSMRLPAFRGSLKAIGYK